MALDAGIGEWLLATLLLFSSIGVIAARKPVHASLFFLLTLMSLAAIYLQLSAQFIAVMQILVYAGAILVIFMFVIVLFQDAYQQIVHHKSGSSPPFLFAAAASFCALLLLFAFGLQGLPQQYASLPEGFGMVQLLGKELYIDFFFPFEAVILLFLVAVVGALYIGKKGSL